MLLVLVIASDQWMEALLDWMKTELFIIDCMQRTETQWKHLPFDGLLVGSIVGDEVAPSPPPKFNLQSP